MKQNGRTSGSNVRAAKQDTKDIRTRVIKMESLMYHFNEGMTNLTNYVKVSIVFWRS